ncbi:MAG TPA: HTH domain-containing protein [Methanocella sp.]|jgi:predicted transcriptional regulator/outer membrane protein assembly factor BamB
MERAHVFEAAMVIALIVLAGLLYLAIVSPAAPAATGWETQGIGHVDYMFVGSNDTLYTFSGNQITAMDRDGSILWSYLFAPEWKVVNDWSMPLYTSPNGSSRIYLVSNNNFTMVYDGATGVYSYNRHPMVSEKDGSLYVFAVNILTTGGASPGEIVKIAPDGTAVWKYEFNVTISSWPHDAIAHPVDIRCYGDRVFIFHEYTQDVLDEDGRLLFSIGKVSRPAAVDENGHIYAVEAKKPVLFIDGVDGGRELLSANETDLGGILRAISDPDEMVPTNVIDAYDANGHLLWSHDIGEPAVNMYVAADQWPEHGSMPLYANGTLYVPVWSGIAALDRDGRTLWVHRVSGSGTYVLFEMMPLDSKGNVYMKKYDSQDPVYVVTIGPDGREYRDAWAYEVDVPVFSVSQSDPYLQIRYQSYLKMYSGPRPLASRDGTVFTYEEENALDHAAFRRIIDSADFKADTVSAYDVKTGALEWNFTVPLEDRHVVSVNQSNFRAALRYAPPYDVNPVNYGPRVQKYIQVCPGTDKIYLYYYYAIYEEPVIANGSQCLYLNSIYAMDNQGNLIEKIPVDGYVTGAVAGNGTIYYHTDSGRIGGTRVNVAAGIALVAIAYMFLRFFMVGAVARARTRLDQNENRNVVLRYIVANPGVTATDLARDLAINIGTIRYHLFILTMNHKVVAHRADNKYLRYFVNAGSYTKEEQSLLALLRREPLRETLRAVAEKPGLSGPELAEKLNVSTTAAHRDLTVLARRGIIEQVPGSDRVHGYSIKDEHRERVRKAMELLRQHN